MSWVLFCASSEGCEAMGVRCEAREVLAEGLNVPGEARR